MKGIKVLAWKLFMYKQIWRVTKRCKQGCIMKTESIGYIHKNDEGKYLSPEYILSNISTSVYYAAIDGKCELKPFLSEVKNG